MAKKKVVEEELVEETVVEIPVEEVPPPAPIETTVKNDWCEMPHTKG